MSNQKTGLDAVFNTKEFQAGLQIYKQGLSDANSATDKTASGISGAGGAAEAAGGLFGGALTGGMAAAAVGALAFIAVAKKVVEVISEMVSSAKEFISESIVLASRWEELTLAAQLMGARMGLSGQDVVNLIEDLKEAGIRADVASKAIVGFSRIQLDPTLALELGKAAQNVAIFARDGEDSSEVLDRLLLGIQRLSPIMLRYAGVNVDASTAYKEFAATAGIVGRELTQVEKQQAFYNATIKDAAKFEGAYELSMQNAGKQMRTLYGREIPTLKAALGAPFQGAFLNVAKAARSVVSSFTDAISEGGRLYPMMVKLGAIADIVTGALANLATKGTEAVINFLSGLSGTFNDSIQSAFSWGFDLVLNFAQGIVDAASSVLVWAINAVSNMLTSWMSPGSPPKMLPDIVKWGVAAMTEYLKGFTSADFGILKNIQSPLKSALDLMVQAGDTTRKKAAEIFLGLSEDIAEALSGTGTIGDGLLDRITKEAGEFGREIAKLTEEQFNLARVTNEVAEAQERVNDAIEKQKESEKAVRGLTDEYNRLLRAGASDEVLAAQLKQINAAEDQAALAAEQKSIAEGDLEDKQSTLDLLKEQVKLQSDLVDQLLQMAKAAIVPAELDPAVAKGGAGGADLSELGGLGTGLEIDTEMIKTKIGEAIAIAKEAMLAKWAEMWDSVKALFEERFGESIRAVQEAWENFVNVAAEYWYTVLKPALEDLQAWLEENLPAAWESLTTAIDSAVTWYSTYVIPILKEVWDILNLIWDLIVISFIPAWEAMKSTAALVMSWWTATGLPVLKEAKLDLDKLTGGTNLWKTALEKLNEGLLLVKDKLSQFHEWLIKVKDAILNMPAYKAVTKDSPVPMAEGLKLVNKQLGVFQKGLLDVRSTVGQLNGMSMTSMVNSGSASQSLIAPSSTRTMNLSQTNNIQSPMDMATFRAMFNQVIREQFAGA